MNRLLTRRRPYLPFRTKDVVREACSVCRGSGAITRPDKDTTYGVRERCVLCCARGYVVTERCS